MKIKKLYSNIKFINNQYYFYMFAFEDRQLFNIFVIIFIIVYYSI